MHGGQPAAFCPFNLRQMRPLFAADTGNSRPPQQHKGGEHQNQSERESRTTFARVIKPRSGLTGNFFPLVRQCLNKRAHIFVSTWNNCRGAFYDASAGARWERSLANSCMRQAIKQRQRSALFIYWRRAVFKFYCASRPAEFDTWDLYRSSDKTLGQ